MNNKVKKSNATFLVIFNHCEYQDQLLIFSVTDMSIFLFVIIITEKQGLEKKFLQNCGFTCWIRLILWNFEIEP